MSPRSDYRLVTVRDEAGAAVAGLLAGDRVVRASDVVTLPGVDTSSVLGLLEAWERVRPYLAQTVLDTSAGVPLDVVDLLAPVQYPRAIFSIWGNYLDHNAEMARLSGRSEPEADPTAEPFFTQKTAEHSIVGTGAPIAIPSFTKQLDYEAELGVVIGVRARNVDARTALDHVAGYLVLNDLTARDMMRPRDERTKHLIDWFGMKCFEGSAPTGPWLTPAAAVPDPQRLAIRLWVNGELKQDGNTSSMVYSVAELVAALSRRLTLRPGDLIATGCPAGVGVARGEFLQAGDEVRIDIEHCGSLSNTIVA